MEEKKILVYYIGVAGIRSEDISDYVERVLSKIIIQDFDGDIIALPIQSNNCRVECINPKYITKKELVNEHNELIKNLNNELNIQLQILKDNNK